MRTHLSSKGGSSNACRRARRRVVLLVLPFAENKVAAANAAFSRQMLPFHNKLKQSLSLNLNSLMLMQQLAIIGDTLNNDIIQATTVCGIEVD